MGRWISEEVEAHGTPCGRFKAKTLMKLAGISAKQKKKFKVTTDSKHNLPVAQNLLNREFEIEEPDQVYVMYRILPVYGQAKAGCIWL